MEYAKFARWKAYCDRSSLRTRCTPIPVSIQRAKVAFHFLRSFVCSFCPSMPSLFGLIPSSPLEDAVVSICNISYPQSLPRRHVIRRRPHHITDFDWLNALTNPTFVVSIGRKLLIIEIGPEVPEST